MHEVWYKDAATVVALVAVAFSVASWWISMRHTKLQEQFTAHVDLRAVLQRLLAVPRDGQDIKVTYKDDPVAYQIAYTTLQQELNVLASQGAQALRSLKKGVVSSAEYLTIGRAQLDAADYEAYKYFVGQACDSAKTPRDKVVAKCERAGFLFQEGGWDQGRKEFREALSEIKGYPPYTPGADVRLSVTDSFQFQMQWAVCEWTLAKNEQEAMEIATGLRTIVEGLPPSSQHDAMATVVANFLSVAAQEIFEGGDIERGRAEFAATLKLADGLSTKDSKVGFAVQMHLAWMNVEAKMQGNAAVVEERLNQAIELVKDQPGTPVYQQVADVAARWQQFKSGVA